MCQTIEKTCETCNHHDLKLSDEPCKKCCRNERTVGGNYGKWKTKEKTKNHECELIINRK